MDTKLIKDTDLSFPEAYYLELIDSLSTPILLYNFKKGLFDYANKRALDILFLEIEDLAQFSLTGNVSQKTKTWNLVVEESIKTGKSSILMEIQKNNGQLFITELYLSRVPSDFSSLVQVEIKNKVVEQQSALYKQFFKNHQAPCLRISFTERLPYEPRLNSDKIKLIETAQLMDLSDSGRFLFRIDGKECLEGKSLKELIPSLINNEHFRQLFQDFTVNPEKCFPVIIPVIFNSSLQKWLQIGIQPIYQNKLLNGAWITLVDRTEDKELELSLQESEAHYRTIAENFPNGMIALYDQELKYKVIDGEALKLLGLKASDLRNKRLRDIFPKEIYERDEPKLLAALNGEKSQSIVEFGGEFFNIFTLPVKNKTGAVISGMVMSQNITDFIESEKKVKNILQQLELAIEHSKLGIWRLNLETNQADWNDQMLQIYEISREDFESEYEIWRNQVHPADREAINIYLGRMIQGESLYDMEFRVISPKGYIKYIKAAGTPSLVEDGQVREVLGINIDITHTKQKEAEFREKEQFLRAIVNNSLHAILVSDDQGQFISSNPAATNIFGYSTEEFLQSNIFEFQNRIKDRIQSNQVEIYFKNGEIGELSFQSPNNEKRVAHYHTIKIKEDFNLSIFADITAEKKAEEQRFKSKQLELKNQELERFAYLASHDLREPLRTMASFAKLMDKKFRSSVGEEGATYLDFIQKAALRMQELINELLEHSRIGVTLNFRKVDCNLLVQSILQDLSAKINESSATIHVEKLPVIIGLKVEMKILFQNLITNAIKFRKDGAKVHIKIDCIEKEYEWEFTVTDNGIGIDPAYHQQIFEIFNRLHSESSYQGTGIGLANCKRVVDIHGGEIWVKSKLGEGSTFYFTTSKLLT